MAISKLEDRQTSKLRDRLSSPIQTGGKTSDIESFRARSRGIKEQRRLSGQYSEYQSAYNDYEEAFDIYAKERDEYAEAISDWKSQEERKKEREEFETAYNQLLSKTNVVTGTEVGKSNKQLSDFKSSLIQEKENLLDVEDKNKDRIEKLDVETTKLLKPFKYYEGLGFASGGVGVSDYSIVGGTGVGSFYYGEGDYSLYDPSKGVITEFTAQPQSKVKEVVVNVKGKTVDPEDIDDLGLVQEKEVVGQQFDFSNYKGNPNYDIIRDSGGNVTEIKAKPISYTTYKDSSSSRSGEFSPEVIKVSGGKVTSWEKYDHYKSDSGSDWKQRTVMKVEEKQYDSSGLLKSRQTWDDKATYKGSSQSKEYPILTEKYQDGVKTQRTYKSWYEGDSTTDNKNYLTGVHTKTDREGRTQTFETGKVELPTGESKQNIRQYGALTGISFSDKYRTAEVGEEPRRQAISHTDPLGRIHAVEVPVFNAPTIRGTKEAFFGSSRQAQTVLSDVPYYEKPSTLPLTQYKETVFRETAERRARHFQSTPKIVIKSTYTGRQSIISKPSKLSKRQSKKSLFGSTLTWGSPQFRLYESSSKKRQRPQFL